MDCRIENKDELKLFVYFEDFNEETRKEGIPALWDAHHKKQIGKEVSCYFGVCANNGEEVFKYGIGLYAEDADDVPEGFQEFCLPEQTWAVFRFEASTSVAVQNAWDCIKREFLSCDDKEYEVVKGWDLEYYPSKDSCEIWIPVRKKG